MYSEAQEIERREKVLKIRESIFNNGKTIKEVELETGIPRSTIQRFLANEKLMISIVGKEDYDKIREILKNNKIKGNKRGGIVTSQNYDALKDNNGQFNGHFSRK